MKAFEAWQRRRAAERIERQEDAHIAALYANTNMDDPENNRQQRVGELQEYYNELRKAVLGSSDVDVEPETDDQAEAFMRAGRRNLAIAVGPKLPGEDQIRALPTAA